MQGLKSYQHNSCALYHFKTVKPLQADTEFCQCKHTSTSRNSSKEGDRNTGYTQSSLMRLGWRQLGILYSLLASCTLISAKKTLGVLPQTRSLSLTRSSSFAEHARSQSHLLDWMQNVRNSWFMFSTKSTDMLCTLDASFNPSSHCLLTCCATRS